MTYLIFTLVTPLYRLESLPIREPVTYDFLNILLLYPFTIVLIIELPYIIHTVIIRDLDRIPLYYHTSYPTVFREYIISTIVFTIFTY